MAESEFEESKSGSMRVQQTSGHTIYADRIIVLVVSSTAEEEAFTGLGPQQIFI